jgi:hypothetical protein
MAKRLFQFFKKTLIVLCVLGLIIYGFKAELYRKTVKYKEINQRSLIKIENKVLKDDLDFWLSTYNYATVEQIVDFAHDYSTEDIHYTFGKCSTNPNKLIDSKSTNCVGYSALFHCVASYLLEKRGFATSVKSEHKVGQLHFLGFNLHRLFKDPAFKDHDYNVITDNSTHKKYVIDPTVSANLGIREVSE